MIAALGFSQTPFSPRDPGRLCRGRERWIEPWEEDAPPTPSPAGGPDLAADVWRLVVSGATFSDDSARDALRGIQHSGIDVAAIVAAIFPRRTLVAFMEDGHPAQIPEHATGVEVYQGFRAGGHSQLTLVRWHCVVSGVREIREVLGTDPNADRVRGFAVLHDGQEVNDADLDALFAMVGMSCLDSPPARFQPAAIPDVLRRFRALVLIHRDKHGPALGVYSAESIKVEGRLEPVCEKGNTLLVHFAIPPMLARWDRALSDLRATWQRSRSDAFPVPQAPAQQGAPPRGRRRRRDDLDDDLDTMLIPEQDDEDTDVALAAEPVEPDDQPTVWREDEAWVDEEPIGDATDHGAEE